MTSEDDLRQIEREARQGLLFPAATILDLLADIRRLQEQVRGGKRTWIVSQHITVAATPEQLAEHIRSGIARRFSVSNAQQRAAR